MLHRINRIFQRIPPIANSFAGRRLHEVLLRRTFRAELDLIEGKHDTPDTTPRDASTRPSIIHFSMNKAATQYTRHILEQCAVKHDMTAVNIHAYAFDSDFPYLDQLSAEEMRAYQHIFKSTGYLYSTFGGMIEGIPDLERYKTLLMVRDPRDILISEYYSTAFSHATPAPYGNKHTRFARERTHAAQSAIDDYAVAESERINTIMLRYKNLLMDRYSHVYITRYEEMTHDFSDWLHRLLDYCELEISRDSFAAFVEKHEQVRPRAENIHRHTRKGRPGEYKGRLRPETIEYLNQKFSPVLSAFEYEV